ncbi:hypothetical protein SPRG_11158 [Saprolegnia parasitica CBS 223.65]|uniref:Apple domain-containing protein n=1 Tax=Saprolegnia parasitica (strain CBS 223.65) TaxID=695850 RepID=A0A067C9M8_SAPPC|nr:hypothetical protein SPRG_11158 [Saprolegnia parasitica CBS 223.65]KDO23226.1 hypothetical protein SPRG_11158 [Saprolegnia parasitica CBS 223.65]|eukprot:XP_012206022.1 hypothetical protein SPRG_11158 [Saprolegnia parasitica CBS 223.65]
MQLLTTTALLAAMAMTTTYARTCGAPEWNTDFYGSDMSNFGTTGDFGNMLQQCCNACTASSTCVAYTLADNVCYLKSGAGSRQAKTGATSVLMSGTSPPVSTCSAPEMNIDYYGNDISNVAVSGNQADQLQACCNACSKTRWCTAFSVANGVCYLKSSDAGRKASPGVVSAKTTYVTTTPTPTPTPAGNRTCGAPKWNTDYYGNDIFNYIATGDFGTMLKQCCEGCKGTPSCGAYTLANNVCYLKTIALSPRTVNGATSVIVPPVPGTEVRYCSSPEVNYDYFGNDIVIFKATVDGDAMLSQCCEKCLKDSRCNAYVLFEGFCYLKSTTGIRSSKVGAMAASMATITW